MHEAGGSFTLTVHPWISGRGSRIRMLDVLLTRVAETPGVWRTTVEEVARHHLTSGAGEAFTYPLASLDARTVGRFSNGAPREEEA